MVLLQELNLVAQLGIADGALEAEVVRLVQRFLAPYADALRKRVRAGELENVCWSMKINGNISYNLTSTLVQVRIFPSKLSFPAANGSNHFSHSLSDASHSRQMVA